MDVLFSIIPGHGHFFPCLPLARALSEAGHSVSFASSATYAETISDHGFEPLSVGPDYTQGSLAATTEPGERDRVIAEMMFEESPPQVIDDLLTALSASRPDVMLVDPYELGGQVVAGVGRIDGAGNVSEVTGVHEALAAAEDAGAAESAPQALSDAIRLLSSAEQKLQVRAYSSARHDAREARRRAAEALRAAKDRQD